MNTLGKIVSAAGMGLAALVGSAVGHKIGFDGGYESGKRDQAKDEVCCIRVESAKYDINNDPSLMVHLKARNGKVFTCKNRPGVSYVEERRMQFSEQKAAGEPNFWFVERFLGVGFAGLSAYNTTSNIGFYHDPALWERAIGPLDRPEPIIGKFFEGH